MPRRIVRQRFYSVDSSKNFDRPALEHRDIRKLWDGAAMRRYATPNWANKETIKEMYKQARQLTSETGIRHEVDHIIPIKHPLVCGLHTENNLRIISASENLRKSNRVNLDDIVV
jgi:hypothetical protein